MAAITRFEMRVLVDAVDMHGGYVLAFSDEHSPRTTVVWQGKITAA